MKMFSAETEAMLEEANSAENWKALGRAATRAAVDRVTREIEDLCRMLNQSAGTFTGMAPFRTGIAVPAMREPDPAENRLIQLEALRMAAKR